MDYKFSIVEDFLNNDCFEAIKSKTWIEKFCATDVMAVLEYPTLDIELVTEKNVIETNVNGTLDLTYFACVKGNTSHSSLAENDGLIWESDDYTGDTCAVDFSKSTWKEDLEKEMVKVADSYAKKKGYSFDKPNF